MTPQTALTEDAPIIVDFTCSFYRNFRPHSTIGVDNRIVVRPDICADDRFMCFKDHSIDEADFDPPHMIRKDPMILGHDISQIKRRLSGRLSEGDLSRYGFFKSREDWLDFLDRVNQELYRVLKPTGISHWKLTFGPDNRQIKEADIEQLTNFIVTERRITRSKKPGSKNMVHWLTLKPKGKADIEAQSKRVEMTVHIQNPNNRYNWTTCEECGGCGYIEVDDNGTNNGEETCDVCFGEGGKLADEWGNTPEDNGELGL